MAYSIGLTAGVVYDEDTDIYQMTSGLANELGKVVFDIDPVTSYSFNYSTQINANPTGIYAGSNGYFETRFGDTENGVTFFMDHSENGADLYVHHNSYLIANLEITNFKFNVPQTMEINCVENTFIMTYDDVFLGDVHCDSNILFNDGWLEFTACNVIGTTAILDSYNYEPNFTVTHTARFMNGISADEWDGILLEHIGDCWWSNADPENSSNMHTMGSIGIGTTDPLYNLHVVGDVNVAGNLYKNGELFNSSVGDSIPIGTILPYFSATVSDPSYLICNGGTYNRVDYIELANVLGVTPTATTFQVPDLRDKFLKGKNADSVGSTGGSATRTLVEANMPAHNHTGTTVGGGSHNHEESFIGNPNPALADNVPYHVFGQGRLGTETGQRTETVMSTGYPAETNERHYLTSTADTHTHAFTTGTKGSGTAFDVLPPFTTVIYIIKAKNNQYITPIRDGDYWTNVSNKLIYQSGNVGIGTNNPQQLLDVNGTIKGARVIGVNYTDVINKPTIPTSSQWTTSGTGGAGTGITYNAGSVGIGTTVPISHPSTPILDVHGSINVNKTASGGPTRIYVASGCTLAVAGPESLDCHVALGGVHYFGYMVSITGGLKVVGDFVVDMTVGAVGTYALLGTSTKANRSQNTTLAGSSLRYASTYADSGYLGIRNSAPAGTWRLCGTTGHYLLGSTYYTNGTNDLSMNASLWYRYV